MRALHQAWGFGAAGVLGVAGLWGVVLGVRRRPPRVAYRWAIRVAIVAILLQVLLGVILMQMEGTRPGNQHVFYGVVISFTLTFAYIYRSQLQKRPAWSFGILFLFLMGLAIRGILTFGHDF